MTEMPELDCTYGMDDKIRCETNEGREDTEGACNETHAVLSEHTLQT